MNKKSFKEQLKFYISHGLLYSLAFILYAKNMYDLCITGQASKIIVYTMVGLMVLQELFDEVDISNKLKAIKIHK